MSPFASELTRAVVKGVRRPGDTLNPIAFFVIVTSMMSLGFEGAPQEFSDLLAVATLWITVLLSSMLALSHAYSRDFSSGVLELSLVYQQPIYLAILGSIVGRWLVCVLPILILVPIGAWMMNLDTAAWVLLLFSLFAGSVVFTTFGILGATFTLGISSSGMLMAVLILPLYVPVLLLGIGAVQRFLVGDSYMFSLFGVFAIAVASITFLPFAIAAVLRFSQEY